MFVVLTQDHCGANAPLSDILYPSIARIFILNLNYLSSPIGFDLV